MIFGGFLRVMFSLYVMAMRHMSMMASFFVLTCFVMLRRQEMVLGSFLMVFRSLAMMFSGLVGHRTSLCCWIQNLKHSEHIGTELQRHCSRIATALSDPNFLHCGAFRRFQLLHRWTRSDIPDFASVLSYSAIA
jgi:hypothetical protein